MLSFMLLAGMCAALYYICITCMGERLLYYNKFIESPTFILYRASLPNSSILVRKIDKWAAMLSEQQLNSLLVAADYKLQAFDTGASMITVRHIDINGVLNQW